MAGIGLLLLYSLEAQDNAGTIQDDNIVEVRLRITDKFGICLPRGLSTQH
jgi:hypothetical protein